DAVETLRLEKEMANLPRPHRHNPPKKARGNRVKRQQDITHQETHSAEKVKALGDAALVVETVIVPTLLFELCPERQSGPNLSRSVHRFLLSCLKLLVDVRTTGRRP